MRSVDPGHFRSVMGNFATGVTVITATAESGPVGMTANAVASLSLEPLLLLVAFDNTARTLQVVRETERFGVNVLGAHHEALARRAAAPGADRFAGVDHAPSPGGAPALADALAFADCDIEAEIVAGDHWIVVARVGELRAGADDPLLFWDSDYLRLPAPR